MFKKSSIKVVFFISLFSMSHISFSADLPYVNEVNVIHFGELLGLSGVCELDYDTKLLTSISGQLCPFMGTTYGEPGKYMIVASPYKQISIQVKSRINNGDGLTYIPSGAYRVFNEVDIAIIPNEFQTINSGSTGVITILIGGSLTSATNQDFNSSYRVDIISGIEFNELP